MSQSTRRKVLRFLGTIIVVLLPVLLAIWFAHIRAVSETRNQLHSFAQSVLDKTERVILQADLARDAAEQYQGQACTPAHQQRMLNIIRGRLYINELIYAKGQRFLCSTVVLILFPALTINESLTSLFITIVIRLFSTVIK